MRQSRRGGLGQGRSRSQRPTHSRSMANSVRPRRGGVYKGNNAANQMRQANKVTKFRIFPIFPLFPWNFTLSTTSVHFPKVREQLQAFFYFEEFPCIFPFEISFFSTE